jgi:F-type H+-transporting ATPase subunit b
MTLLLSAEGGGSGRDLLLPAAPELVWGLFAFIVLFLVMRKLVLPNLNAALDDRRALIEGKMEEADAKLVEMEEAKRAFEASLGDARGEAARILEEARSAAESSRETILATAREEAQRLVERATADANAERVRLLEELRGQVGALSVQLAERIVERELDAATHSGLVDEYIQRLAAHN